MSDRRSTKCDLCALAKTPIIYVTASHKLCRTCFTQDRELKKKLIRNLPDVRDKDAPRGFHLFETEYFISNEKGKAFADAIFRYNTGVIN